MEEEKIDQPDKLRPVPKRNRDEFWGRGILWGPALVVIGGAFAFGFYFGNNKFDKTSMDLYNENKILKDTVLVLHERIGRMRTISDSALNILGGMPYKDMTLDTMSYRKVQTTIEKVGSALYLNR